MGFELVGKVWDVHSFAEFLKSQDLRWASGVTMHHTAYPSLAMRPNGLRIQHIKNIRDYYRDELGWSAGPHLFVDDDQIFGMSSLEAPGVHARSFNRTHIGVEVLGNYDREDPMSGRGAACWQTAAGAVRAILKRAGWSLSSINGHRDDPRTNKTCPGTLVSLEHFLELVSAPDDREDDRDPDPPAGGGLTEILQRISAIEWQCSKIKKLFT